MPGTPPPRRAAQPQAGQQPAGQQQAAQQPAAPDQLLLAERAKQQVELETRRVTLNNRKRTEKGNVTKFCQKASDEAIVPWNREIDATGARAVKYTAEEHKPRLAKLKHMKSELERRLNALRQTHTDWLATYDVPTQQQEDDIDQAEDLAGTTYNELIDLEMKTEAKILKDEGPNAMLSEVQRAELKEKSVLKLQQYDIKKHLANFDGKSIIEYARWRQSAQKAVEDLRGMQEEDGFIIRRVRSVLEGDAKKLVEQVPDQNDTLGVFFNILDQRYLRRHVELKAALTKFMAHPPMTGENADQAQNLLAVSQLFMNTLRLTSCGDPQHPRNLTPEEMVNAIFLAVMESKLSRRFLDNWMILLTSRANVRSYYGANVDADQGLEFLATQTASLVELSKVGKKPQKKNQSPKEDSLPKSFVAKSSAWDCIFCSKSHNPLYCAAMPSDPLAACYRLVEVKVCLGCGHKWSPSHKDVCTGRSCDKCPEKHLSKFHNALLEYRKAHKGKTGNKGARKGKAKKQTAGEDDKPAKKALAAKLNHSQAEEMPRGLLRTCLAYACGPSGINRKVRLVLDSGSQITMVTNKVAQELKLSGKSKSLQFQGVGQRDNTIKSREVRFTLKSLDGSFESPAITAATISKIASETDEVNFDPKRIEYLADLNFTEVYPRGPSEIDILVSEPYVSAFMRMEMRSNGDPINYPCAQLSAFGWILQGNGRPQRRDASRTQPAKEYPGKVFFVKHRTNDDQLNLSFERFIKNETMECREGIDTDFTIEQQEAVDLLEKEMRYNKEEQCWETGLLFKKNVDPATMLSDNKIKAKKILESHFARMSQAKRNDCDRAFRDLLQQGFVEKIPDDFLYCTPSDKNITTHTYLELLPVFRESESTACRLVFNLSSKTRTGYSLNDLLYVGPNFLPSTAIHQIKNRMYPYILTYDLSKCFLRIKMGLRHRNWQRILYQFQDETEFQEYWACTQIFGAVSSPFVAQYSIRKSAELLRDRCPRGYEAIMTNLYVDDGVCWGDTPEECREMFAEVLEIMRFAGQKVHKTTSNARSTLQDIDPLLVSPHPDTGTILGMNWDTVSDKMSLSYPSAVSNMVDPETKRQALQILASCYDTGGLTLPLLTVGKLLMSQAWATTTNWDDRLPEDLQTQFKDWLASLSQVTNITFPRFIGFPKDKAEIFVFCDASLSAIGACAYAVNRKCKKSHLIYAKSKVVRYKDQNDQNPLTISRLELNAAQLAVKLATYLSTQLEVAMSAFKFFTDSAVTLARIRRGHEVYKTYVANRVKYIADRTAAEQWGHVQGAENPSDKLTKYSVSEDFCQDSLWFHGPDFVFLPEDQWPVCKGIARKDDLETKSSVQFLAKTSSQDVTQGLHNTDANNDRITALLYHFGDVEKGLRILALVLSAIALFKGNRLPLMTLRTQAYTEFFRILQKQDFEEEIGCLTKGTPLPKASRLSRKTVKLNEDGLIVEVTRFPDHTPIVLLGSNELVQRLLLSIHVNNAHCMTNAVLQDALMRFSIVGGQRSVRDAIAKCKHRLCRPLPHPAQVMAPLPPFRLDPDFVSYSHTQVDAIGPLLVSEPSNSCSQKVYILTFMCLQTRHIHLQPIRSLAITDFLDAFFLFTSHHGIPSHMYSDNALTFRKARKVLGPLEINKDPLVQQYALKFSIEFHFGIPLHPESQGGVEAMNRLVKSALRKVLYHRQISWLGLKDLLPYITALTNDRPYCKPDNSEPLSPNRMVFNKNFFTGRVPFHKMEPKPDKFHESKIKTMNEYWKIFSNSYLQALKPRRKWKNRINPLPDLGATVLIVSKNLPRSTWEMARVVELIKGSDGEIRSVLLDRGNKSQLKRYIGDIAILEEHQTSIPPREEDRVTVDVPETKEEPQKEETRPRRTKGKVDYKVTRPYRKKT